MKRAIFMLLVGGIDITAKVNPILISLTVNNSVGTHSDTVNIDIDDTNGQVLLPTKGAPIVVMLGWEGEGARMVFTGTVDEIRSSGDRGGGRTLSISGKGMDTTKKPKQAQQRHFDNKTVKDALTDAGKDAGITEIEFDPDLASITREYIEMRDESFIHFGERMAREIGGNFHISGNKATMTKRDGTYTAFITATVGDNLHSWDIAPALGRPQFNKTKVRYYDRKKAILETEETETSLDVEAEHFARYPEPNKDQAKKRTESDKATTERDAGEGSVTIEGNTGAIPDGLCIIVGARPGVDGAYRIESASHSYNRGGGFVTSLQLKAPQGGAGTDSRAG